MHKLKLAAYLLGMLLVASLTIATVMLVVLDEDEHGRLAVWAVEKFTGYKLTIGGTLSLEPAMTTVLKLTDVTIEPDQPLAAPITAHFGQLTLQIGIKPLLSGILLIEQILAENAAITFNAEGVDSTADNERKLNGIDLPFIKHAGLKNINFTYIDGGSDASHQLAIHSFTIDHVGARDPLHIQGQGILNGTNFTIGGDLGSVVEAFNPTRPYPVDLSLQLQKFGLNLSGTIDDPLAGDGLNIAVSVEKTDLSTLLAVVGIDIPELGDINLHGTVIGNVKSPGARGVDVNITGGNGLEFTASGEIDNLTRGAGANITFSGKTTNKQLLGQLLPNEQLTEISIAGDLYSEDGHYAIKSIQLTAANAAQTVLKASGNVEFGVFALPPEVEKVDLDLALSAANTAPLQTYLFDWLPDAGPLSGTLHLGGSADQLSIENMKVSAGDPKTVWVSVTGSVGQIPLEPTPLVTGIDLSVSITAADAPQLVANFGLPLPALEKVTGNTRITGSSSRLAFDQIEAQLTDPGGVTVNLAGTASLGLENPEPDFRYDLNADLKAKNVTSFRGLLVATTLPDLGPVRGSAHVSGTTQNILLRNLTSSAGNSKSLLLKTSDGVVKISFEEDEPVIDLKIPSSIHATNTTKLANTFGLSIPELGAIDGTYTMVSRQLGYGMDNLVIAVSNQGGGRLKAKGDIENVMTGSDVAITGINVSAEIDNLAWSSISELLDPQIPDLGKISGHFLLSGDESRLVVSKIDLSSKAPTGLTIHTTGNINDINFDRDNPVDGVDVKLVAKISDVNQFSGTELPLEGPVDIDVRVTHSNGSLGLNGDLNIGKTGIHLSTAQNPEGHGPEFVTSVTASTFHLADFGIYPKTPTTPDTSTKKSSKSKTIQVFSDHPLSFEFLKENEFALKLDIKELVGTDFVLTDLDIDATLEDSVLRINPAKLTYADGAISAESRIDASGSTPEIMLKVAAEDIDVGGVLSHIPMPGLLGGHLNIAADLSSRGSSPRQIASSLTGEVGFAIENGKIKKLADLVGADALDFVTTARKLNEYEKLNCLAIVFEFDNGIGTSKAIVADTPKLRTHGMGTINLINETVDIGLHPQAKRRRLAGSSPVQIKGPLSNPSVRKLPLREATELYGTIFLPFVFLPARALGYVWHSMGNDKLEPTPCLLKALGS